jgi:pyruvate dehydrogenase E1 component beta subunit
MPWTKIPEYGKEPIHEDRQITYMEAVNEALRQAMDIDPSVIVLGEGVDDPGGVFGSTQGLADRFGKMRVMDMPLSENSMAGITIGAAHAGMRPVCVHMRTDFLLLAMDQIANHAAKWSYMFGGRVKTPVVFRAVIGRGWGSGAQHAQALYPLFMHFPGLRVIAPFTPLDAKGMILSAVRSNDPVIVFEHRWLYGLSGPVPEEPMARSLEGAQILREGDGLTLVASGLACKVAQEAADDLKSEGVFPEVIDLRSLKPLDTETIGKSLKKTGRLLVFDYSWETCGLTSEVMARMARDYFSDLKQAPESLAFPECPIPASPVLESAFYPGVETLKRTIRRMTA